jgi:hypothetical protein
VIGLFRPVVNRPVVNRPVVARLASGLLVSALLVSGCSSSGDSSPTHDDRTVQVLTSTTPTVLAGTDPQQVSIAATEALLTSTPAVILTDGSQVEKAAGQAKSLGLPVLIVAAPSEADQDGAESATSASTSPTPSPSRAQAPNAALEKELDRLGARHILTVGDIAREYAKQAELDAVTNGTDLPRLTRAKAQPTTIVLGAPTEVSGLPAAGAAAAFATATAIGATVVQTATGDPRADPAAISTLAKVKPARVITVGPGLGDPVVADARVAVAATGVQLPGGGQLVLPGKLYVAMYGHPDAAVLGVLGEQSLDDTVARANEHADPYRPLTASAVIPTFEIITTVATNGPTDDDDYSRENDPEFIRPWIERAQADGIYVILDLQPGTDTLLEQAKMYESLLAYPNVGLAVDPEWKLQEGQRPLRQIGTISVDEINEVSGWLAEFTRARALPQKLFVIHQFRESMIDNRPALVTGYDQLSMVIHVDGQGPQGAKLATWDTIRADAPAGVSWGWKNFYDEDPTVLTPEETMQIQPTPVMISYQ